jgi:hypothetical protein
MRRRKASELPADLDLGLDIVDGVAALDLERDGLPGQRLHEYLHLACSRRARSAISS